MVSGVFYHWAARTKAFITFFGEMHRCSARDNEYVLNGSQHMPFRGRLPLPKG